MASFVHHCETQVKKGRLFMHVIFTFISWTPSNVYRLIYTLYAVTHVIYNVSYEYLAIVGTLLHEFPFSSVE